MQYPKIKATKPIYVLLAAIFLSGCQIWPDYQRPKVDVPAQYVQSDQQAGSQSMVANNWWTLYQDPVLTGLIESALENNKDIKLAVARIEEADAVMQEVGAFLLPQINLEGDARKTRVTEAGAFPVFAANPRDNFNFAFGTNFELDFWGKLRRSKESAKAQAMSTRYAKDTVALSLTGLVASNYLTLRSLESQITLAEDNLKSRNDSLALTKRRLEGGVASALDVHQAQVASSNLSAQIADLNRLRSLSLHQLALLTGDLNLAVTGLKASEANINALPIPPVPPTGLPSALLESRPDVRQAEEQMVAANANIAVAKAALYPSISLTASLGGESLALGDVLKSAARIWTGGVALNLPIFDAGRLDAKVDQASAKQKQALANYEGAIQTAFREVNDALVNLRQYTEREQALFVSQNEAKKALTISENRYQSGYSSYIEVLDAQRAYNESGLAFVQSRQARLTASVDLFKALGGGWKSADKP
ncbi:MAG TPA: efflux transporter outer membrane subunit [Methylotenera sp.]|nr:efflux transporter outer membrane subunit [Methylotenera sp.]